MASSITFLSTPPSTPVSSSSSAAFSRRRMLSPPPLPKNTTRRSPSPPSRGVISSSMSLQMALGLSTPSESPKFRERKLLKRGKWKLADKENKKKSSRKSTKLFPSSPIQDHDMRDCSTRENSVFSLSLDLHRRRTESLESEEELEKLKRKKGVGLMPGF